jgi:molybdopterin converting factor subunit 1
MTIRVTLLYFGQARDAAGTGEESFTLPERSSVRALLAESSAAHARLSKLGGMLQFAVNEEIARPSQVLKDGDVVAFLPPVAGG